jgi:hypothetical protein
MPSQVRIVLCAFSLLLPVASSAWADALLVSGSGGEMCRIQPLSGGFTNCGAQTITPAPHWQQPVDGASWISFGDTGYGGTIEVPVHPVAGNHAVVMQIREDFFANAGETLSISAWAGGTLDLTLRRPGDGFPGTAESDGGFMPPDFSSLDCVLVRPGCVTPGTAQYYFDESGVYSLFFAVFQLDESLPFGLMYTGTVADIGPPLPPAPVPEPASIVLFGIGALATALRHRRRQRVTD